MRAQIRIGTSGFSYPEWKSGFYPPDLPQKRFLEHYASRFPAVEIDATFYRMPSAAMLEGWTGRTPPHFRFALKASRRITHQERLRLPSEAVDYLTSVLPHLGERLGVVLFQLPPNFTCDPERLELFLATLDPDLPRAVEFRHVSWFSEQTYALLRRHRTGLVIHDAPEGTSPIEITGPAAYVRLRRDSYPDADRERWLERFRSWQAGGVDVYAFVKHKDNPDAPAVAEAFLRGL